MIREFCEISEDINTLDVDYSQQYFNIYQQKLNSRKNYLEEQINNRNDYESNLLKIGEIETDKPCFLIGIITKIMSKRVSYINEIENEDTSNLQKNQKFISDKDMVYLDDGYQRIELTINDVDKNNLITGIVLALKGVSVEEDHGIFDVKELIFPNLKLPANFNKDLINEDGELIIVISGLNLNKDRNIYQKLLSNWLTGRLYIPDSNPEKISRLILLGDSIDNSENSHKYLDEFIKELAPSIPIMLVPSLKEYISNHLLPQPAPHSIIFQESRKYSTFTTHSNPSFITMKPSNRSIVLFSGHNIIEQLAQCVDSTEPLDIMQLSLENWAHICPLAPDLIDGLPLAKSTIDPLSINHWPSIYLMGIDSHQHTSRIINSRSNDQCLLATIPSFADSLQAVLINTHSLKSKTIKFNSEL